MNAAFRRGEIVRVTKDASGMPRGSTGQVIGRYTNTGEVVVMFWDGGPLRMPPDTLESVGYESLPAEQRGI